VRFLDDDVDAALDLLDKGGVMVVPAAPALVTLSFDETYRQALTGCDFAILDSAYLALLWFLATGKRLHRVSGLHFLRAFLAEERPREKGALFLVNPSEEEGLANLEWLRSQGFDIGSEDCYTAPMYRAGQVEDAGLVDALEEKKPKYVMLNIGGGTQERLAHYLRDKLSYRPAIMCTGAAIAFLTGRQATIPRWVDRMGLGWLARCIDDPARYVPRYMGAVRLARLVFTSRHDLPPLR